MTKQEITHWFSGFCPTIEIDGDKIFLDGDHLLVSLEPKDDRITLHSEIHDVRATYIIGKYDYETVDKLIAVWGEFMNFNRDQVVV
jgi:hypothetical protein